MVNDELVKKAQNGDKEAINQIIENYHKIINFNANNFYLIGGEKEDLIQEGVLGLLKAISSFDFKKSSFNQYAILCIRRNILSAIKTSVTQKNNILNNAVSVNSLENEKNIIIEKFTDKNINIEEETLSKEKFKNYMNFAKKNFSNFEKEVLLYLIRGYSYKEIAILINKNNKQIDNTIQRIKNKSEKWLETYRKEY